MTKVFFFACVALVCISTSAFSETQINLVPNGDASADWTDWNHSANTSIRTDEITADKCFQFQPSGTSHSDIRTNLISVTSDTPMDLHFSLRTLPGAYIEAGSSLVQVRSYNADGLFIGESNIVLATTDNQWQDYYYQVSSRPNAVAIDVRIIFNAFGPAADGTMRIDNIAIYYQTPNQSPGPSSAPLYHDLKAPDKLYLIINSVLNNPKLVAIQTIQGIAARKSRTGIWLDGGDSTFYNDFAENHGVTLTRNNDFNFYLRQFKNLVSANYILYDTNDHGSLTAASTMAGVLDAVAVDVTLKSTFDSQGYTMLMDLRGKDDKWVYENYNDQLCNDAVIVHTPDPAVHGSAYLMRDWAAAIKCLTWWNTDLEYTKNVYDSMAASSPVYGWLEATTGDELGFIDLHSRHGLYQIPCDWLTNLSVLAAMGERYPDTKYKQKVTRQPVKTESNVHYVAFMMSDMDNILTLVSNNSFINDNRYFANSARGTYPMGWGMAPSLTELAPTAIKVWYDRATANDSFTAQSGLGYFYPHNYPNLNAHTERLSGYMERADIKTLMITDNFWPRDLTWESYREFGDQFADITNLRGMFYVDVNGDYARYAGKILWFKNKPLVTCRYTLWIGSQYNGLSSNASELAASINALPADPKSSDGYTFIVVHAWSYGLDEVTSTISKLAPHVRVVTPEEMIEQLYKNFTPCIDQKFDGDFDGNCKTDIEDLQILSNQWLNTTPDSPADTNGDSNVDIIDFSYMSEHWTGSN